MKSRFSHKNFIAALYPLGMALGFLPALLWWELGLGMALHGGRVTIAWGMPVFLPALCLGLSILPGIPKKDPAGRGIAMAEVLLLAVFYSAHFVYCRIFGSLIPLSMAGMGTDAVANFGWALQSALRENLGLLLLFLLPVPGFALWLRFTCPEFHRPGAASHAFALAGTVLLWGAAVCCLPLGGTEAPSAYSAYHDTGLSTDLAAERIGVLTNSLLEGKNRLWGVNGEAEESDEEIEPEADEISDPASAAATLPPEQNTLTEKNETEAEPTERADEAYIPLPAIDFEALAAAANKKGLAELSRYFASQEPAGPNAYTGLFRDYDLIYICAEAFSSWAVDPELTPTLYRLSSQGIRLPNYYNSFRNTTTNGEFALLTGLWPDTSRAAAKGSDSGSMSQSAQNFMPYGLGTLFRQQLGANAYGYHNYLGSYYNRKNSLENLGFTTKFMDDGMTFSTTWPASDLEMMQQSVEDYIHDEQYVAYYMTFSGHGPYTEENVIRNKNIDALETMLNGRIRNDKAKGYLACNLELEYAMEYLLQRLQEEGRLERTVIVLAGDHYPYFLDPTALSALTGHTVDQEFEASHSGCILWCGALEGEEPIVNEAPCCNVDILPTVLNLFGLDYDSRLLAGRDVFGEGPHLAVLYNRNSISDTIKYNYNAGRFTWIGPKEGYEKQAAQAAARSQNGYLERMQSVSNRMIAYDYYNYVWSQSGWKSEN